MYLSKRFAALPPRKKALARLALYGGLAVVLGLLALGVSYLARPLKHRADQLVNLDELMDSEEVRMLQEYIQIDTSTTTGSELEGARFLAKHLEAAGLETHVEQLGQNKANLWAVLEGDNEKAIVLHNHIDVYSAVDPEAWDFPPFGGVIDQAWIYGRGAFDMKSLAIAQLATILELARDEQRPKNSIIFLASGSEEVGSDLGSKWILANHPELVERFALVLTEGGVVEAISYEEVKYWGVESAQKWFAAGWACAPTRERLEALSVDLFAISQTNHELRITPDLRDFVASYANSRSSKAIRETLGDLEHTRTHAVEFINLPYYLKSLFRDETAPFEVEPDPEGDGYRMKLILHLLPGSDFEDVKRRLLPDWATLGTSITLSPPAGADHGSPVQNRSLQRIFSKLSEAYPDATIGPYFLAWSATDARFFRQSGTPTYGLSPFLIFATDTFRRDTLNERIDLRGYYEGVRFYKEIVRELANDSL